MFITHDDSKPEGSMDKYLMIVKYDGVEGHEPFSMSPHWHKVCVCRKGQDL